MRRSEVAGAKPPTRFGIARSMALTLACLVWWVAIPLAHGVIPWAISSVTPRYGWTHGQPGVWNLLGLIPVVVGTAGLIWIMVLGFAHASEVPERVELDWRPKLLLMRGPYAFTRNPMYVAELGLWLGWAVFFGSVAVLIGFVALCAVVNLVVRREERDLEARFGEAYRQYRAAVPRWLGKVSAA
ncbi:MAG: isoprenylcysteine carboxylmethyltransferase family protein [Actinomycetota bacterium]|nr:isoprenylcysteine carboxylmethyltransferase family protein [Actinomycetota bacterium]